MLHSKSSGVITIDLSLAPVRWLLLFVIAGVAILGAWFAERWYLGNVIAEYAPSAEAGGIDMAGMGARWAPSDPYTHWRLALLEEENFSAENLTNAIRQYQLAVTLSPHDYRFWMELGRELDAAGDTDAAEKALRQAVELAPAYSYPRWYFGNILLREGKLNEAFDQLRPAARNDEAMRPQVFSLAWQAFDKDVEAIVRIVCPSSLERMQFVNYLVSTNAFDDAMRVWALIPPAERKEQRDLADQLQQALIDRNQFRKALDVLHDVAPPGTRLPEAEQFWNGGFEDAALTPGIKPFGWTIVSRPQLRVDIDKRPHDGRNSLRFDFKESNKSDTNQVSQTIAVKPETTYRFECYASTQNLNSAGMPVITILDAADHSGLASSQPLPTGTNDWQRMSIDFKTRPKSEGIILNFSRAGCDPAQLCPIFGTAWYDDFSLQRINGPPR
jgi:hypothetical protein